MDSGRRGAAFRAWAWVAFAAAVIFYLSSLSRPLPAEPESWFMRFLKIYNFDKLAHMLEYGLFGWLLTRALAASRDFRSPAPLVLWALFLGCLYGASDEWHQSFVPLRESSIFDWIADAVGVSAGIMVWLKGKAFSHARH